MLKAMAGVFGAVAALAAPAAAQTIEDWQQKLYVALKAQGVIAQGTQLVSMNYVCTLKAGKARWKVIDTIEYLRGANLARAENQIVLVDSSLKLARSLRYANQRPLFCIGNTLYLSDQYAVDNLEPRGNSLSFDPDGAITVGNTDPNAFAIPPTQSRPAFALGQ